MSVQIVYKWKLFVEISAIGGAGPPPSSAPSFTPQPPPQANPPMPTSQPYGGKYLGSARRMKS